MPGDVKPLLDRVCELIAERLDARRVAAAKRRHADMLAWRESDYIPILFARPVAEAAEMPGFDWARQWHDPAASLYMQLKDNVLPHVAAGCDYVPGVRADTGVVNCMAIFGAAFDVPAHTKPVVTRYVAKDRLREFQVPQDVSELGIMPQVVRHVAHHLSALAERGLGGLISVYHCDQQGPFDIAAQTRGHDLFTDLYDDPEFAHELMGKAVEAYVAVSRLCKRLAGQAPDSGNAVGYYLANGGVRMCGDSDILVRPDTFEEFILPYEQKAFEPFGGGWMHYCGGWPGSGRMEGLHLHELYARIEGLRGLNWTTAGDWLGEMRKLKRLGVVHLGGLPRGEGEVLADYFRRVLSPYDGRCGMIFSMGAADGDGEGDSVMEAWHRMQDDLFGR